MSEQTQSQTGTPEPVTQTSGVVEVPATGLVGAHAATAGGDVGGPIALPIHRYVE